MYRNMADTYISVELDGYSRYNWLGSKLSSRIREWRRQVDPHPLFPQKLLTVLGIANMKPGFPYVAALSNANAQYWGTASPSGGAFAISNVLPGTYTLTIYKGELGMYSTSVTISAGTGLALHTITPVDPFDDTAIWRIGDWDGSPAGFTNFDKTPMLVSK